uniref:Peptidase S1 domain-containing protein n=1 Tax=Anopheles dirus TaxID=7168 RepID=A0A182NRW3_9DIPT
CRWLCLTLLLGLLACSFVEGLTLKSPCPTVFTYRQDRTTKKVFGLVELNKVGSNTVNLSVELSIGILLKENNFGSITLVKSEEQTKLDLTKQQPVQYIIRFPNSDHVPAVQGIKVNDQSICTGQKLPGKVVTTFFLEHSLVVESKSVSRSPSANASNVKSQGTCGIPSAVYSNQAINGTRAAKGQFPWATPIFDISTPSKSLYICGSTIITQRHLVTAAHCMYNPLKGNQRNTNELSTVPGMYNIDNLSDVELQVRNVLKIFIHEDYVHKDNYLSDSDIAVLGLQQSITYNDLVRPICLWEYDDSLDKIVGMKGLVSGWGVQKSEDGNFPRYLTATIVDRRDCSRNIDKVVAPLARLFCANGHGSAPCTDDTGSGIVIKRGERYFLRGIVSVGQFDVKTQTCAKDKYVVCTDIAPFRHWFTKIVKG